MLNILVVDDEGPIRDWVVYCIEREANPKFHIIAKARNGNEGLEFAQIHRPDLVITDIMMPGMDGLEMMKAILKVLPYTSFIILSNYAEFSYARTALAYGAKHYLLKSELRATDLLATISTIHEEKIELLQGKVTDMYAVGLLDVFDLYQHPGDAEFARSFMRRHGLQDDKPYCVLGLQETNLFVQKQLLDTLISSEGPQYSLGALQKHTILVLLQDSNCNTLEKKARRIAEGLLANTGKVVAITRSQNHLSGILSGLTEAEQMVLSAFFYPDQPILTFSFFHSFPLLDRQQLWKTSMDILEYLQLQDCQEVLHLIVPWLEHFDRVRLEDILWAKETCLRMVFTIEERLLHTQTQHEDGRALASSEPKTCIECKKRILDAIHQLDDRLCGTYSQRIYKALAYIHSHYQTQMSMVEVADKIGLSPEYFSRLFKEKTGENFSVYLMMFRIQQAHKLLMETNIKIFDIANQVGYTSASYFTKIYKRYMGINPEEVRKKQEMSNLS